MRKHLAFLMISILIFTISTVALASDFEVPEDNHIMITMCPDCGRGKMFKVDTVYRGTEKRSISCIYQGCRAYQEYEIYVDVYRCNICGRESRVEWEKFIREHHSINHDH